MYYGRAGKNISLFERFFSRHLRQQFPARPHESLWRDAPQILKGAAKNKLLARWLRISGRWPWRTVF